MKKTVSTFALSVIAMTGIITTLAISPGVGFDPINVPKMLTLVAGSFFLLVALSTQFKTYYSHNKVMLFITVGLLVLMTISTLVNQAPLAQQIWGTWGRSTGLLTYLAFILLMLASNFLFGSIELAILRQNFERLSYFITFYTLVQLADLDPINWSQKLMVATLGNINFMSSFLGLATCSMLVRLLVEKLPVVTRLHYFIFLLLNFSLMWISQSIQGLAVAAAGFLGIMLFRFRIKKGFLASVLWLFTSSTVGLMALIGSMGYGPLAILRQETVLFRIDYWLAGINMTLENWRLGVGIDSYGDYYEQYRNLMAVQRTGPQRVTNTAHNIFLDVSSGAGLLAGILFVSLFVYTFARIIILLKIGTTQENEIAWIAIFFGYFIFCLISINQIGVGVWGFISIGCVNAAYLRIRGSTPSRIENSNSRSRASKVLPNRKSNISVEDLRISKTFVASSLSLGTLGLLIAFIPNYMDAKAFQAFNKGDIPALRKIATSELSAAYYRDRYMLKLMDSGNKVEAAKFALQEIVRNPRSKIALQIVAYETLAPKEKRMTAIKMLLDLDPLNIALRQDLTNLKASMR